MQFFPVIKIRASTKIKIIIIKYFKNGLLKSPFKNMNTPNMIGNNRDKKLPNIASSPKKLPTLPE